MTTPLTRIRQALSFLGVVSVVAVVGYHFLTDKTWLDSIYWYVITVSTVGYGEHSDVPPQVQIFSMTIIAVGLMAVAYAMGGFVQLMIEGEIQHVMGARRMTRKIDLMSNHTIMCGFGRIGHKLAEHLKGQRIPFVILDRDESSLPVAEALGYIMMIGDATDEEVLRDAGIDRAKTFIVGLHSDVDSVFITLTARGLNPKLQIIACGERPSTEKKLLQAGADRVVMPGAISARRIATLVDRPIMAEFIDSVSDHKMLDADLEEISISKGSPLEGKTIREAAPRERFHVLFVAIRRDKRLEFSPDPDNRLQADDTAIVMGRRGDVERFRREMET